MTLGEAGEILRYWETHPPPHLLLAAIHGIKHRPQARRDGLPPGLAVQPDGLGMPAPLFDLDEMRAKNRTRAGEIARRNADGRRNTIVTTS